MNRRTIIKTTLGAMGMAAYPMRGAFASNPDTSGFKYLDEAAPHERTFMQWPVNREVHTDSSYLTWLQKTIAMIANTIADFEPVFKIGRAHV